MRNGRLRTETGFRPVRLAALAFLLGAAFVPGRGGAQPPAAEAGPFFGMMLADTEGSHYRDPVRLARMIESLRESPFDRVAVQVLAGGEAYFRSPLVPIAAGVPDRDSQGEAFDPLAEIIAGLAAGDRPKKVIAWIDPFRVGNARRVVQRHSSHVLSAYPEWICRRSDFAAEDDNGDQFLEPGMPQVQAHLEAVVGELASRYELSGILIGGLRYPGFDANWGYDTHMLDEWRRSTGLIDPPTPENERWREMRRNAVTECLKRMRRAAEGARPGIRVLVTGLAVGDAPDTAAGFKGTTMFTGAMQDWPGWMKASAVDGVVLLNHRDQEVDPEGFAAWNQFGAMMEMQTGVRVIPAVSGAMNFSREALTQARAVHETGLAGFALATYARQLRDEASVDVFHRALAGTLLSPESARNPFPPAIRTKVQVSLAAEAAPGSGGVRTASGGTTAGGTLAGGTSSGITTTSASAAQPGNTRESDADAGEEPSGDESAPFFPVPEVSRMAASRLNLIDPDPEAIETLRRMYRNIFPGGTE